MYHQRSFNRHGQRSPRVELTKRVIYRYSHHQGSFNGNPQATAFPFIDVLTLGFGVGGPTASIRLAEILTDEQRLVVRDAEFLGWWLTQPNFRMIKWTVVLPSTPGDHTS